MSENRFLRRYFFYGTLLAGAVPAAGFGTTPSLKSLGYKSLLWDNSRGEFSNSQDTTKWIKPAYRKGWDVKV